MSADAAHRDLLEWQEPGRFNLRAEEQLGYLCEWVQGLDLGTLRKAGPRVPVERLMAVPETVHMSGVPIKVSAHVWRDFMPSILPGGLPMIAFVIVHADPPAALPPRIRAERIAVIHDDEVWIAPLAEEQPRRRTECRFEAAARNGPAWAPGQSIDVIVQLRGEDASTCLVRSPRQPIERTA